jgi:hypothetical protein
MMEKTTKFISIFSLALFFPLFAFAATTCTGNGLGKLICQIGQLLNSIIPILVALGVVYFIWGVIQYMTADGEEDKKKGRERIVYGLVGFAIIIGLWGLVNILINTFNLSAGAPNVPKGTCSGLTSSSKFQDLLGYITCLITNAVIPLLFAAAAVVFVWGVVQFFIIGAGEENKRAEGRQFMIWGIIAITAMLCVWGLVNILGSTFGLNTSVLPTVRPPGSSGGSNDGFGGGGDIGGGCEEYTCPGTGECVIDPIQCDPGAPCEGSFYCGATGMCVSDPSQCSGGVPGGNDCDPSRQVCP